MSENCESKTPRTDAETAGRLHPWELCRELERELAEFRRVEPLKRGELVELRAECKLYREALEYGFERSKEWNWPSTAIGAREFEDKAKQALAGKDEPVVLKTRPMTPEERASIDSFRKAEMAKPGKAEPGPCREHIWPCPTCGAVDMTDAGNKCRADWVCSADDQRQHDYERDQSTPNNAVRVK